MRARYPDRDGFVESQGVRLFFEEYGRGARTLLLIPPWQMVHSRIWKAQIPYLARYFRVITYDVAGTGRSDRPRTGYDHDTGPAQTLAGLAATGPPPSSADCHSRTAWP